MSDFEEFPKMLLMEDPADPNVAYVKWPYGYAEVHGSRYGRDRNARLFAAAPLLLAALELTRSQWIHSVNAKVCLAAIAAAKKEVTNE